MKITGYIGSYINEIRSHFVETLKSFKLLQRATACICILIPVFLKTCDQDQLGKIKINPTALAQITNCKSQIRKDTITVKYRFGCFKQLVIKDCRENDTSVILTATIIKKGRFGFRESLSHYAYSSNSYLFGMLYCMAAMMFIYNGVVYMKIFKSKKHLFEKLNKNGSWYNIIIGTCLLMVVLNPLYDRPILHVIFAVSFFLGNIFVIARFPNKGESKTKRYIIALVATICISLHFCFPKTITVLIAEWLSLTVISIHLIMISCTVPSKIIQPKIET